MSEQEVRTNNIPALEKEETLLLLSELHKSPHLTQRELALRLNVSLGKINYLIKELIKKGLLKIRQFSANPGKFRKVRYNLTRKGIEEKMALTYRFLIKKETEYNNIKKEWEQLTANQK